MSRVLVRAAVFPTTLYSAAFGGALEDGLAAVWADPVFAEALWVASPSLAADVELLVAGSVRLPEKRRRAVEQALSGYVVRATSRATPFGAFAGVAVAGWGDDLSCTLGPAAEHTRTARLDYGETLALARAADRDPRARPDLRVYANPAAYPLGGRLTLAYRPPSSDGLGDQVSVRLTGPVTQILDWTREPVVWKELLARLVAAHPATPPPKLSEFLSTLLAQEILVSTVRPPLDVVDPLDDLRRQLPDAATPVRARAEALAGALGRYTATPLGSGREALRAVYDEVGGGGHGRAQTKVQVDLALSAEAVLPRDLGDELGVALDVLARLGAGPLRATSLSTYAREFTERYGSREVPLLELLDPYSGLGPPAGYHNPPSTRPAPEPVGGRLDRDVFLHSLVSAALCDGLHEVVLDPDEVAAAVALPAGEPPASLDVFVQLGVDVDGCWTAVLPPSGLAFPAGRAAGRFAYLGEQFAELVDALADVEREAYPDVAIAGLTYAHPRGHTNNVGLSRQVHAYQIAVATTPGVAADRQVRLADVRVRLGKHGLALVADGVPGRLLVRAPNLLNPSVAPNAARFLLDVSQDDAWLADWDWGRLGLMPFLPRVRVGRVVLSPATWRLPASALEPGVFPSWRERVGLPRFVHAGTHDNRLLLDLDHPVHERLLRREIAGGLDTVTEALPALADAAALSAAGRHVLEAVIPMRSTAPVAVPEEQPASDPPATAGRRLVLPGMEWTYAKVYGPPALQDSVLRALERLLPGRQWFFVRYADPLPQLRIRVSNAGVEQVLTALNRCVTEGLAVRYTIDAYEREIERYGGEAGLRLCESVSCVDTMGWLSRPSTGVERDALAAFSVETLLRGLGVDPELRRSTYEALAAGYAREFADDPAVTSARLGRGYQERRTDLRNLLRGHHAALEAGEPLEAWSAAVSTALRPLGEALGELDRLGRLSGGLVRVLASLVHLHANRAGLTRRDEYRVVWLLRRAHDDVRWLEAGVS